MKPRLLAALFLAGTGVPAMLLGALAFSAVRSERTLLLATEEQRLREAVEGARREVRIFFDALAASEGRRPVEDYQAFRLVPETTVANTVALEPSPLSLPEGRVPGVTLHFQFTGSGVFETPFGSGADGGGGGVPPDLATAAAEARADLGSPAPRGAAPADAGPPPPGGEIQVRSARQVEMNNRWREVQTLIVEANSGDTARKADLDRLSVHQRAESEPTRPIAVSRVAFRLVGGRIYGLRTADFGPGDRRLQGFRVDREAVIAACAGGRQEAEARRNVALDLVPAGNGIEPLHDLLPDVAVASRPLRDDITPRIRSQTTRVVLTIVSFIVVLAAGLGTVARSLRQERRLIHRREDLLSAVTHELRTPLAGIRMHAEMLKEGWTASPERREKYLSTILSESERLSRLIESVLGVARLRDSRRRVHPSPFDPREAAESVIGLLAPAAERAAVTLCVMDEGAPPRVLLDRDLFVEALTNLVENGIKYARPAGAGRPASVEIRIARVGGRFRVVVDDDGVGVPERDREAIFDPFYRVETEATRTTRGTGIGLALVKAIVVAHGGRVSMEPRDGGGSRFTMEFPDR